MSASSTTSRTVHLYVFDGYADWEPAYAVAGIGQPAFQRQPGRYRVRTVGEGRRKVVSLGGLAVLPDLAVEELRPTDSAMLVLPGGDAWYDPGHHRGIRSLAREFTAAGVPLAAICGAVIGLAREGLLDQVAHTANQAAMLEVPGYRGRRHYSQEPAVDDGGIITAGAGHALEFAAAIFRRLQLYRPEVLTAWLALFRGGDPQAWADLVEAAEPVAA